ncbi:hypothetical protein P4O66_011553 [Electrophorus voltai]|uniref:Uncharacterized protein n=1 Tax=Electrophorus voltai TaxID=2609070 RepID=A0AAD8Z887_9TELE|nr:hypothetical protein P4O66_011553 [Electrophorus voltai]
MQRRISTKYPLSGEKIVTDKVKMKGYPGVSSSVLVSPIDLQETIGENELWTTSKLSFTSHSRCKRQERRSSETENPLLRCSGSSTQRGKKEAHKEGLIDTYSVELSSGESQRGRGD